MSRLEKVAAKILVDDCEEGDLLVLDEDSSTGLIRTSAPGVWEVWCQDRLIDHVNTRAAVSRGELVWFLEAYLTDNNDAETPKPPRPHFMFQ